MLWLVSTRGESDEMSIMEEGWWGFMTWTGVTMCHEVDALGGLGERSKMTVWGFSSTQRGLLFWTHLGLGGSSFHFLPGRGHGDTGVWACRTCFFRGEHWPTLRLSRDFLNKSPSGGWEYVTPWIPSHYESVSTKIMYSSDMTHTIAFAQILSALLLMGKCW